MQKSKLRKAFMKPVYPVKVSEGNYFSQDFPGLSPSIYDSLIGYYANLDSKGYDGTCLVDLSGNANHARLIDSPVVGRTNGFADGSLVLNGTSQYGQPKEPDFDIVGSLTLISVIKLNDGQPASGQMFLSKYDDGGIYGYGLKLETTGKVSMIASDDGVTIKGKTTVSIVFANGPQAFSMVTGVYESDISRIIIYHNDTLKASTDLGGGGPGTRIASVSSPFLLGAEASPGHYLSGYSAINIIIADALNSRDISRIYNIIKRRDFRQ